MPPPTLTWQSLDLVQCHLNTTVHLELWPGNRLIWGNATLILQYTSNSDLAITWFGAMPPQTLTWQSLDLVQCHLQLWPGNHLIWCNATSNSDLAITWFGAMPPPTLTWQSLDLGQCHLNTTVHLELWPGNHLIWGNATCSQINVISRGRVFS